MSVCAYPCVPECERGYLSWYVRRFDGSACVCVRAKDKERERERERGANSPQTPAGGVFYV